MFSGFKVFGLVAGLACAPVLASAQENGTSWTVGPIEPGNCNSVFCRAQSPTQNGVALVYRNYYPGGKRSGQDRGAGLLAFNLSSNDAGVQTRHITIADVAIDPVHKRRMRAIWAGRQNGATLSVSVTDYVDQMIRNIGSGKTASISIVSADKEIEGRQYSVSLKGSYEAMIDLEKCLGELPAQ